MTDSSFKELVRNLFNVTKQTDTRLDTLQQKAVRIETKYNPRSEFNRWRDSQEGIVWKQKKYYLQNGCCAICRQSILLKGSHIDHIKPLSLYPNVALDINNLQITCPDCNLSKQAK